jgi:hypothetical protein
MFTRFTRHMKVQKGDPKSERPSMRDEKGKFLPVDN